MKENVTMWQLNPARLDTRSVSSAQPPLFHVVSFVLTVKWSLYQPQNTQITPRPKHVIFSPVQAERVCVFSSVCVCVFPALLSTPLHREVNGIDARVIPAQALSSAALFSPPAAPWPPNNHTPLFLFTICQRWRENWRKSVAEKKRAGARIDRLPHVLKPDIDFLSFFFQMGKSALSDRRRFLWGFGERGVEMSIRCTVVSCGLCIGLW